MKTAALLLCLLAGFTASAQTKRPKLFRAIVYTETGVRTDGILYELTDSTLRYVRNTPEAIAQLRAGRVPDIFEVSGERIEKIVLRRKGHVGRGFLYGAGLGLVSASVVLLSVPPADNLFTELMRRVYVPLAIVGGAQYGMLASILPRKFKKINRSQAGFESVRVELLPFSYRFQEK